MDTQLQQIIEKIHAEGVKGAEERAQAVLSNAEKQATERVAAAKKQAEQIVAQAQQEAARLRASAEASLQQSGRDLILAVKRELEALFERVVTQAAGSALSPDALAKIIAEMVTAWSKKGTGEIEVLVSDAQAEQLKKALTAALSKEVAGGVEIRPVKSLAAGFRIGAKSEGAHYDFSVESIAALLAQFVNPYLAEILAKSGEGESA